MIDPVDWTPERRATLRDALRKSQAAQQQREVARLNGQEGLALYLAARDFAAFLDAVAPADGFPLAVRVEIERPA